MVIDSSSPKPKGKGKSKNLGLKKTVKKRKGEGKILPNKKGKMAEAECFFCHKKGHCKPNCASYLENKKKQDVASSSVYSLLQTLFCQLLLLLGYGDGSHICNSFQGLKNRRELRSEEVVLQIGNGASIAAGAVGNFHHTLASGAKTVLRNCYCIPNFLCNVISISSLTRDVYSFVTKKNVMNILFNDILQGTGELMNVVYVLSNDIILNISKKRKESCFN